MFLEICWEASVNVNVITVKVNVILPGVRVKL